MKTIIAGFMAGVVVCAAVCANAQGGESGQKAKKGRKEKLEAVFSTTQKPARGVLVEVIEAGEAAADAVKGVDVLLPPVPAVPNAEFGRAVLAPDAASEGGWTDYVRPIECGGGAAKAAGVAGRPILEAAWKGGASGIKDAVVRVRRTEGAAAAGAAEAGARVYRVIDASRIVKDSGAAGEAVGAGMAALTLSVEPGPAEADNDQPRSGKADREYDVVVTITSKGQIRAECAGGAKDK